MMFKGHNVLVTGGASFIGSHLVEALLERGAYVRVVDNFSKGFGENLPPDSRSLSVVEDDLLKPGVADIAVQGMDIVFHLAANHGGRGYVDAHQADCATNFLMDGLVFKACLDAKVGKVVYASSGCVYPSGLQKGNMEVNLSEDMVGPPYDADNTYGYAKLIGEMTLRAYHRDYGLQSVCPRYFTVYGERGLESHAVMAMISRAFRQEHPFQVWGTGEQIRNWTYVSDIVEGTLLAAEHISDGSAVNLGTMEKIKVIDAVKDILKYTTNEHLKIQTMPEMPTGPYNRVADNSLAKRVLGWSPKVSFIDGLHKTIDWYYGCKNQAMEVVYQ